MPFCKLLKSGYWQISPEAQELVARKAVKHEKGYVLRPMQGIQHGLSTTPTSESHGLSAIPNKGYFTGEKTDAPMS